MHTAKMANIIDACTLDFARHVDMHGPDRVDSGAVRRPVHPTVHAGRRLAFSLTGLLTKPPDEKKTGPQAGFSCQRVADYFLAASAATSAAVEAAEAASAAAAEAVAAAAAASAAGVAAASVVVVVVVVSVVAAGAAASVVVVAAGASTAAGVVVVVVSSFFEQAARATAISETISRDFFMVFP